MKKLIKIIAAIVLLLGSTAAEGSCDNKNNDNTVKDCFSDTGSSKPVFIDIVMNGGERPFEVSGYARDTASGNKVDFHEVITVQRAFTRKLMYISGCKVHVWLQVKNPKPGFTFIRADEGKKNYCRVQSNERYTHSCEFTTSG